MINLSTWPLTSEHFWPSHFSATLWCLLVLHLLSGGFKEASFKWQFNCFHCTQVSWLSSPSLAEITPPECLDLTALSLDLRPSSDVCVYNDFSTNHSKIQMIEGVKHEFPVSSHCNDKSWWGCGVSAFKYANSCPNSIIDKGLCVCVHVCLWSNRLCCTLSSTPFLPWPRFLDQLFLCFPWTALPSEHPCLVIMFLWS